MVTPTNDQDRLIDQALSLLRNAMGASKTVLPVVRFRSTEPKGVSEAPLQEERAVPSGHTIPAAGIVAIVGAGEFETPPAFQSPVTKQAAEDVPPPAPTVQEQQTASLINQTLSMVAVAISEATVRKTSSPSLPQPVAIPEEQAASLIAQALSMVKSVDAPESEPVKVVLVSPSSFQEPVKAGEAIPSSSQETLPKTLTAQERLDMERANIRNRVKTFKANQQRFQREREEYYEATIAKVRSLLTQSQQ